MKVWSIIPSHYKFIGLALLLTALFLAYNIHRHSLIQKGRAIELAICNAEKQETIDENIDTRKRQDKVVPIDGKRSLISGLRDDTAL